MPEQSHPRLNMPNLSPEEADQIIAKVREDNGGITAKERDFLLAKLPGVLRALQNTRRQLADSTKVVVDNLYSKETRFLYELIQNAEDNSYSVAAANGKEPFLAFKLYPDKILVDSNEDGFSESNVRAICAVGKSTKKHSAGYVGQKGIGFKSVFKIARKVHIQSGPFSFVFSHSGEDDDDGLGMVTPYHQDAEELPADVRTRITLTLSDSVKFEELTSELGDVPDTLLVFLHRLQRLSIELYPSESIPKIIQYSKRESRDNELYTTVLEKILHEGEVQSKSQQKYYTMKRDLRDLPFDEARKDSQGNSIDQATTTVAFPVDDLDQPVIEQQYTYAFLPLRQAGFKFLVHADFITQANREDVVHSKRNYEILKGVAETFTDAVVALCELPTLKYQWMRYLPEDTIIDEFWKNLRTQICERLEGTPLLEPWSGEGLYKPSELQMVPPKFLDGDGNPLLPDVKGAETYLSSKYSQSDFQILKCLGTRTLQWENVLDSLDADLRSHQDSKWRQMEKNCDWRTRICNLLESAFTTQKPYKIRDRLSALPLIPLCNGTWVSATARTIKYFPKIDGIPVPVDLGYNLVCPMAVENSAWKGLMLFQGVFSCPASEVLDSISQRYNANDLMNFEVSHGVDHLRFLYWFLPSSHSSLVSQVRLANQQGVLLANDQCVYFPEGDEYSPSKLFKKDARLPGHLVDYLHGDYLKAFGPEVVHNGSSWSEWLEQIVGVRRVPRLRDHSHSRLSEEFRYIIKHRSDLLLDILKRAWTQYRPQMNDSVKLELLNSQVLLENGSRTSLKQTFLPLPRLKKLTQDLLIVDAYPFIDMRECPRDEHELEWIFLKNLGVGTDDDVKFHLDALMALKSIQPVISTESMKEPLLTIYQNIQSKSDESPDSVRNMFEHPFIWMQLPQNQKSTWLSNTECVWDGPDWLISKHCLKQGMYLKLERLLTSILRIPNTSQIDIINDLLTLKRFDENVNSKKLTQSTGFAQASILITHSPFQHVSAVWEGEDARYQSITAMEGFKKESFEELRLKHNHIESNFLDLSSTSSRVTAFARLEASNMIEECRKRYNYLWRQYSSPLNVGKTESRNLLPSVFEYSALIYIPSEKSWRSPSQCVWTESDKKMAWKASIADIYPSNKAFFTEILKVAGPTIEMCLDSLKAQANGRATAAQIIGTMAMMCDLGIRGKDISALTEQKFLPVRLANRRRAFVSASEDESTNFVIFDNVIHRNLLTHRSVTYLDFSLEEVRDTRPLLLAMGLGNRFSSKVVKEMTQAVGCFQDHEMTKCIRTKSQAVTRCVFHFADPENRQDAATLYRKFKRAIVLTSQNIKRSLHIVQDGWNIVSVQTSAYFHLEESAGILRLYLPKDMADQYICFDSDLPHNLCRFLSITDPAAPSLIGSVFRNESLEVIDKIFENLGISEVACDFLALDQELSASETRSDIEGLVETVENMNIIGLNRGLTPPQTATDLTGRIFRDTSGSSAAPVSPAANPQSSASNLSSDTIPITFGAGEMSTVTRFSQSGNSPFQFNVNSMPRYFGQESTSAHDHDTFELFMTPAQIASSSSMSRRPKRRPVSWTHSSSATTATTSTAVPDIFTPGNTATSKSPGPTSDPQNPPARDARSPSRPPDHGENAGAGT